ncbi:DUF2851 family protein [bacterium SCSIO 12741]|nr:DUF2851 family protein [bacterium SCSIO 12741]
MKETDLYRIWEYGLLQPNLQTLDQKQLRIFNPGTRNHLSGPDYSNARIAFDGHTWAGQVEIHVKSSDWFRHGHHHDPSYQSIVLHVVYDQDKTIPELEQRGIPTLELKSYLPEQSLSAHSALDAKLSIPCSRQIDQVPSSIWEDWKLDLLNQRLKRKSERIERWLVSGNYDWGQVFHIAMARSLGYSSNGEAMEQLANRVPIQWIRRSRATLEEVQAWFLGASGWLDHLSDSPQKQRYITLFQYAQRKYSIVPIEKKVWKSGGVRPENSPIHRILQCAEIAHHWSGKPLLDMSSELDLDDWVSFFLGSGSYSKSLKSHLLINAWVPILYCFRLYQHGKVSNSVFQEFFQLPAELNRITKRWKKLAMPLTHAGDSQAILELEEHYCSQKKCLFCSSGKYLLHK